MSYYIAVELDGSFDEIVERTIAALADEGFGVLTQIDVRETMRKKLDVDFPEYRILGACNPPFAHKALLAEDRIGTMLPCNVIVRATATGSVEVAAVDPLSSMQAVQNASLEPIAIEVRNKLAKVVQSLHP